VSRPRKAVLFLLALAGILALAWLLRDVAPPPDCMSDPADPACKAP
jgi:hypothetical protein